MHLLDIQSSPRGDSSDSITLTKSFIEACTSNDTSIVVDTLNVWQERLPEFDYEGIGAKYKAVKHETMAEAEPHVWGRIQSLIQRFQNADRIVLGTLMWNFGLPYKLKQLIDLVAPRNYLFAYDGKQYGPLLEREYSVSRDNDLLGGMWAVMATIFVFRYRILQSGRAAISRTLATFLSFALCFLYFLIFPFNVFGMVALIWIGTVILCLIGHSEAIVTTAITTAVAFVVAGISPGPAWIQPILRLADSAVGIVSGFLLHGWELPFSVGKENGTDLSDLRQTLFTIER